MFHSSFQPQEMHFLLELLMVKCSKCGNEAEGTAEHGKHLKAHKHL
jgi:hypothetical protein